MTAKRALKRQRAKERKRLLFEQQKKIAAEIISEEKDETESEAEIEYVPEALPTDDEQFDSLKKAFARLSRTSPVDKTVENKFPVASSEVVPIKKDADEKIKDESDSDDSEEEIKRLSNKKRKLRDRLTIAQLKQVVERPDLVELHDPNSPDPAILIHIKSMRNTIPVPSHWKDKRRYLQGKRGYEKASFVLPKAIQDTGVAELRNPGKLVSLKQKQRQRMNPKLGRLDVDYQKLHAAFFRHMVKPPMTTYGEAYYAGKENEVRYRKHRPGKLSKRLKNALHMMDDYPPPFLLNMQRFGPPPAYPHLSIPGLNAPLPPGCKYGYSEGQWGKPPVDDRGYPQYGDPFGINSEYTEGDDAPPPQRFLWGAMEDKEPSEDEEEEDEAMEEGEPEEEAAPAGEEPAEEREPGLKTPEVVALRKNVGTDTPDTPVVYDTSKGPAKKLYQVLDKKDVSVGEKATMGSSHTYDIASEQSAQRAQGGERVSVALSEAELASLDELTIRRKFESGLQAQAQEKGFGAGDAALARDGAKRKKSRRKKKDEMDSFKF